MAADVTTPLVVGEASGLGVDSLEITLTDDIPASMPDSVSMVLLIFQSDFPISATPNVTVSDEATPGAGGAGQYLGPNFQAGVINGYGGVFANFVVDESGTNHAIRLATVPWVILEPLTAGQKITLDFGLVTATAVHVLAVAVQGFGPWYGSCSGGGETNIGIQDLVGDTGDILTFGSGGDNAFNNPIAPFALWDLPPASGNAVGLYVFVEAGIVSTGLSSGDWIDPAAVTLGLWTNEGPGSMSLICGYREFDVSDTSTFDTGVDPFPDDPGDNKAVKPTFMKPGAGPPFCVVAAFGNPTFNRVIPV